MLDDARMQKLELMPLMSKSLKKQKSRGVLYPQLVIASGLSLTILCDLNPDAFAQIRSEFYIIVRQGCRSPPLNGGVEPCSCSSK